MHVMERKVDAGPILAQRAFPVWPRATLFGLYVESYRVRAPLVVEALDRLEREAAPIEPDREPSRFWHLDAAEWRAFRARGGRVIDGRARLALYRWGGGAGIM